MLSIAIDPVKTSPIFCATSLKRRAVLVGWSRQVAIQLTVFLVSLFYGCAVLEIDLGETGDSFGDAYDTYVLGTSVRSPQSTAGVKRKILPAQAVIAPINRPVALSVDWSFVFALAPLAFFIDKPPKRRRLQVMHAIWRL